MVRIATIIDRYTVEPSGLGVPPGCQPISPRASGAGRQVCSVKDSA
jgi:radical SAM superfamily enzyme with C-terminal helix-hairpin-helix motif